MASPKRVLALTKPGSHRPIRARLPRPAMMSGRSPTNTSKTCCGAGLVVPEGVKALLVAAGAHRVGEAEIAQGAELLPGPRQEQGVAHPGCGMTNVGGGRNDVVIARQNQRFLQRQPLMCIMNKPI